MRRFSKNSYRHARREGDSILGALRFERWMKKNQRRMPIAANYKLWRGLPF